MINRGGVKAKAAYLPLKIELLDEGPIGLKTTI
jgi:hypothetical protein